MLMLVTVVALLGLLRGNMDVRTGVAALLYEQVVLGSALDGMA